MPKITAPLFSLTAAGTIAGLITYRTNGRAQIAQANRTEQPTRTPRQARHRTLFLRAANAWHEVPAETRTKWRDLAVRQTLTAWNLYLREYLAQNVIEGQQPIIPNLQG